LRERGWHTIASYEYSGTANDKAPRLRGLNDSCVVPDLDASKDGRRIWVEVKTKSRPTQDYKTGRDEHGIPKRHYYDYLRVQAITGCKVYLLIYEECNDTALVAAIDNLETRFYDGPKMSRGGMVFFPREQFRVIIKGAR